MIRFTCAIAILVTVAIALTPACSKSAKHRVLSFFLDGVPDPGKTPQGGIASTEPGEPSADSLAKATPAEPVRRLYTHTPYRKNDCAGCHDQNTGELVRPLHEGLCLTCHSAFAAGERYLHGPVAVGDCAFCHHHHSSPVPGVLREEPTATCLNCHDREDLTVGEHHSDLEAKTCAQCHDPHGGEDRYFLIRSKS